MKWHSVLLIGLVVLLASSMVACGESPAINFSSSSLSFSAEEGTTNPASQTLNISNPGILNWSVYSDADWLSLSPTSGSNIGEIEEVTVDTNGLNTGNYTANIRIFASGASNSPQTVIVNLAITPCPWDKFNSRTGRYKDFYLGLVYYNGSPIVGDGCYGEFIVLINNNKAKNPSYSQLLNFLKTDKTDEFPYESIISMPGFYYGAAESQVDLTLIKHIIDGDVQPYKPNICGDFAERLHNDAELTGIRCGYVILTMDNGESHACDVFETTDKGQIFIDDTGISGYGPSNCDKIVNIQIGRQFTPQSLFPEHGWALAWGSMGIVADFSITWDGNWRNYLSQPPLPDG